MHWTDRGVYLHLEASELIEAVRGKGDSSPTVEAGDVFLVLLSITEYNNIPFSEAIKAMLVKLEYLEKAPPYENEERTHRFEDA